jgi:YceI-like domain
MKNNLCTLLFFLFQFCLNAQDKVIEKNGKVTFEASVPSFEEVKAILNNGVCALNLKTGNIASIVLIKSFKFKNSLMQEHFNENYMESDKYPKATFKGKIENFNLDSYSNNTKIIIAGTFEIHGKTKNMSVPATIKKSTNEVELSCLFVLKPEDFNIDIPSIVGYKIAKTINVNTTFTLKQP